MSYTLEELQSSAELLPAVPVSETDAYCTHTSQLIDVVNTLVGADPAFSKIVGAGRLALMYDNHRNHAAFMSTVFIVGDYKMLARTVIWVYRTYRNHGFSYDYFPIELRAWLAAITQVFGPHQLPAIESIYTWMLDHHDCIVTLSQSASPETPPYHPDWADARARFLNAALRGDSTECLSLLEQYVHAPDDLESFYEHVIQSTMYEVGLMWERSEITVAREHLVSAIVTRVMAGANNKIARSLHIGKKAVITAAPNEFHEVGAWMIADILTQNGWDVLYLGANTPQEDLLALLAEHRPNLLGVSVTMPFNLTTVKELIHHIRASDRFSHLRVIVGGGVFVNNPGLWSSIGADGFAANLSDAKRLAGEL